MAAPALRGHLFIIDGDLNRIHCDAVLIPSSILLDFENGNWARRVPNPEVVRRAAYKKGSGWPASKIFEVPTTKGPRMWVGDVGLDVDIAKPYVDVAETFIRTAHRALADKNPIPRLALNVVGTGDGGMRGDKGQLVQVLVKRLLDLADELVVDIVLVTWGLNMYGACQRARVRVRPTPPPLAELIDPPDPVALDTAVTSLVTSIRARRLVVFVGAGVSMGAGLPSWQGLLDELAIRAGWQEDELPRLQSLDVRDQAQVIAARMGEKQFKRRMIARLSQEDYALAHGLLASLDPHEVVTTNYDTLMEQAFGQHRRPAVLPRQAVGESGRWLLKLHGTVEEAASIILTRSDYLGLPDHSQALFGIVQAMLMTKQMLFIGYSLSDDSFHRVVHEVRRARRSESDDSRMGVALTLFPDPMLQALWGDDLTIVPAARRTTHGDDEHGRRMAARSLDIVLDRIGQEAADVSSFLLDPTYNRMLDRPEKKIRDSLIRLRASLDPTKPIDQQILRLLSPLEY